MMWNQNINVTVISPFYGADIPWYWDEFSVRDDLGVSISEGHNGIYHCGLQIT